MRLKINVCYNRHSLKTDFLVILTVLALWRGIIADFPVSLTSVWIICFVYLHLLWLLELVWQRLLKCPGARTDSYQWDAHTGYFWLLPACLKPPYHHTSPSHSTHSTETHTWPPRTIFNFHFWFLTSDNWRAGWLMAARAWRRPPVTCSNAGPVVNY